MIRFRTKLYFTLMGASMMLAFISACSHAPYLMGFSIGFSVFYHYMANLFLAEDTKVLVDYLTKEKE